MFCNHPRENRGGDLCVSLSLFVSLANASDTHTQRKQQGDERGRWRDWPPPRSLSPDARSSSSLLTVGGSQQRLPLRGRRHGVDAGRAREREGQWGARERKRRVCFRPLSSHPRLFFPVSFRSPPPPHTTHPSPWPPSRPTSRRRTWPPRCGREGEQGQGAAAHARPPTGCAAAPLAAPPPAPLAAHCPARTLAPAQCGTKGAVMAGGRARDRARGARPRFWRRALPRFLVDGSPPLPPPSLSLRSRTPSTRRCALARTSRCRSW